MRTLIVATLISAFATIASGQDKAKIQKEIIEVDRARQAAVTRGDGHEWVKYIADNCLWTVLETGEVAQDKMERAARITRRGQIDDPRTLTEEKFHIEENRVVQTGLYSRSDSQRRFARIYAKLDGRWQMITLYFDKSFE